MLYENSTTFKVTETLNEVEESWKFLHDSYCNNNLINKSKYGIHTVPQAINPETITTSCYNNKKICGTISVIFDGSLGLPLDLIYPKEIKEIRKESNKICEIGLLSSNGSCSAIELLKYGFFGAIDFDATHAIIGVHPTHVKFYEKCLNMRIIGKEKKYFVVNNNPVVMLMIDRKSSLSGSTKVLKQFIINPVPKTFYDKMFKLSSNSISGSIIKKFLIS